MTCQEAKGNETRRAQCVRVCVFDRSICLAEHCVIKHIRSFHQDYKTFPSPIVSAWLDYELPILSAASWVLDQAWRKY